MIEQKFVELIAEEVGARPEQIAAAVQLLDRGATVPFVAHYRKDVTGNLDEHALSRIEERNVEYTALMNRRNAILQNIEKLQPVTDDLRERIMACHSARVLEDLYLPYRRRRRTRASVAIEQRLGPLADYVWAQELGMQSVESFASQFIDPSKSISSAEEALDGARAILTEKIAQDAETRVFVRDYMLREGKMTTAATKNAAGQKTKFEAFYHFSEPLMSIPSHRLLAAFRGVKLGYLRLDLAVDDERLLEALLGRFLKITGTPFEEHIRSATEDAYRRYLRPELEKEILEWSREQAEEDTLRVFQENARNLLLAPPAGPIPVIGIEPDAQGAVVAVAVDEAGAFQEQAVLHLQAEPDAAADALLAMMEKYGIRAVAVGNAPAARDTMRFVDGLLKRDRQRRAFAVYVSESGAAVYAASKLAREEFPQLETAGRAAVSVARRLQDPLSELVKIEPRNIGVGQYQHEISQRRLRDGLSRTLVSCVNRVGANVNTASVHELRYVSGIQMGTAQNIVAHREKIGGFKNRTQLLEVDGIGPKTFEQCAGFLRIRDGEQPLDATAIHPEAYPVVEKIAQSLGVEVAALIGNREVLETLDLAPFSVDVVGPIALADIRVALMRPGRDPRRRFRPPHFIENVYSVEDLQEGMEAEGIVTNVTDFGAFVDIGIQQDGLVHLSELANRFVRDPRQVVKVGDIVRVKVIKVDRDQPRISLSIRAAAAPPRHKRPARRDRPPETAAAAPAQEGAPAQREAAPRRRREREPQQERGEERRPERPREGREGGRGRAAPPRRDRRPRGDRQDGYEARRMGTKQGAPTEVKYSDGPDRGLNTLLAEQLAELKKKMGAS
ncbi:MAG: helix-hairpin-helix domain-containing protein [Candidatus Hydrogenedentes bacterium]|nr:helix-hairpin-helix domain-containing protein [Candidatus Hydrogenedentota bacterium]